MKEKKLYREVSLQKLSSAEQLNDYIKVASPGVWMIIVAIIIFIAGAIIYMGMTSIETKVEACVEVSDDQMLAYVSGDFLELIQADTVLTVDDDSFNIISIDDAKKIENHEKENKFIRHMLTIRDDADIYAIAIDFKEGQLENGYYVGEFPIETVKLSELIFDAE